MNEEAREFGSLNARLTGQVQELGEKLSALEDRSRRLGNIAPRDPDPVKGKEGSKVTDDNHLSVLNDSLDALNDNLRRFDYLLENLNRMI